jgi:hypothetical protein
MSMVKKHVILAVWRCDKAPATRGGSSAYGVLHEDLGAERRCVF